ncbi:MAG: phosphoglycerate dehydrogenase [Bacteroidia bacterium]
MKILIIDECHPILLEKLKDHECLYLPSISLAELDKSLADIEVLIMRSKLNLTADWIDKAPKLKAIGRLGSGMDNIDVDYAQSIGIKCLNAPEGNRVAVAEQTIGMLLSLLSNVFKGHCELKSGIWDRKSNQGAELMNSTVGIIGYGNVGSALAERLSGFGVRTIAYDLYKTDFSNDFVTEVSLEELKQQADIISLHVPLNEHSKQMVNRAFIQEVSKPFILVNLSRGDVVNTIDLKWGLESGNIKGLAIDVFEQESLEKMNNQQLELFKYFTNHPHVIFSPHIGGLTLESFEKLASVLADKLLVEIS